MNNTKLVDVEPLSDFESKTRLLLYGWWQVLMMSVWTAAGGHRMQWNISSLLWSGVGSLGTYILNIAYIYSGRNEKKQQINIWHKHVSCKRIPLLVYKYNFYCLVNISLFKKQIPLGRGSCNAAVIIIYTQFNNIIVMRYANRW